MDKIFILMITFIMSSCVSNKCAPHMEYGLKIIGIHKTNQKKLGFNSVGTGGSFLKAVNYLSIDYEINEKVGVEEARTMYVKAMESMLELCNSDQSFREHMCSYPFTTENIQLSISFEYKARSISDIAFVFTADKMIRYYISVNDEIKVIHIEPYEEARKMVLGESKRFQ